MTLPIYPPRDLLPGLTYGSKWSPSADIDVGLAQYPLHDFELTYEMLRDGRNWGNGNALPTLEFRTMMGFHLQIGGTLGRFLFKNVDDHQVFQNVIGTGDGVTTTFILTRTFGANGFTATEPVGQHEGVVRRLSQRIVLAGQPGALHREHRQSLRQHGHVRDRAHVRLQHRGRYVVLLLLQACEQQ